MKGEVNLYPTDHKNQGEYKENSSVKGEVNLCPTQIQQFLCKSAMSDPSISCRSVTIAVCVRLCLTFARVRMLLGDYGLSSGIGSAL